MDHGDRITVRRLLLVALIAAGVGGLAGPTYAQPREEARVLSPEEIADRLARRGYRDVGRPHRRGQIFLVEATDRDGARRILVVTVTEALVVGDGPAQRTTSSRPLGTLTSAGQ
jgi:hypothetical protein